MSLPVAIHLQRLEYQLQRVRAHCRRAIAEAWDTGRIAYPAADPLPFAAEVAALAGDGAGRASEVLAEARRVEAELLAREPALAEDIPQLADLARRFALGRVARDLLVTIAMPHLWGELARLYAILAGDPARSACDETLLAQLLGPRRAGRLEIADALDPRGPLLANGLVVQGTGVRPFAALTPHPLVVRALAGEPLGTGAALAAGLTPRTADRSLAELRIPEALRAALRGRIGDRRLALSGREGSGRKALLAAAAAERGLTVGLIDARRTAAPGLLAAALSEALVRGWLPCIEGEIADADLVADHPGPVALLTTPFAPLPRAVPAPLVVPDLGEGERVAHFRAALAAHRLDPGIAEDLAARHVVGAGAIERAAAEAERTGTAVAGVLMASRDARIAAIAARVTRLPSWQDLVLPAELLDSVRELVARVRHRRQVFEGWGFDRVVSSARGLTALFEGPPGTGKTMVAGVIARELGAHLYRVDLSRVLSKWIGETEKNLGRVFDAAQEGQVVLLFDEADALFGKRTEVKSSSDRFANAAVDYLLTRLDAFEGIAILTTNLGSSIDAAFKRRLSLRLSFPFPDETMRADLWRAHLPPELDVDGDLDLAGLAERHRFSGGYIKNAALRAAFLAAHDDGPLRHEHLERAVSLVYRDLGSLSEGGLIE